MTISYSGSLMALASGARGSSSFDWHSALPHGHSILSPSILAMSSSRQVFVMSQEMSSPAPSRAAMMSEILALQPFVSPSLPSLPASAQAASRLALLRQAA